MKNKLLRGTAIVLAMVMCMAVGAFAATNLQEIKAYLNYDLAIRYDGELQTMYDANGNQVLPISYNGTTYLPIRAVGNMMGIDVLWDGENYQVLLGKTGQSIDFIEHFEPYHSTYYFNHIKESENRSINIGSQTYSNWIYVKYTDDVGYYDISGKYTTLTFSVYSAGGSALKIYGDNDQVLAKIDIKAAELPKTYTVSVKGVQQISFENISSNNENFVLLDMTIE